MFFFCCLLPLGSYTHTVRFKIYFLNVLYCLVEQVVKEFKDNCIFTLTTIPAEICNCGIAICNIIVHHYFCNLR